MRSRTGKHNAHSARDVTSTLSFNLLPINEVVNLVDSCRHVKALESRSQLLDAALAGADEANRRWEETRVLVDQLRIENTALRTALQQVQSQLASAGIKTGTSTEENSGEQQSSEAPKDAAQSS